MRRLDSLFLFSCFFLPAGCGSDDSPAIDASLVDAAPDPGIDAAVPDAGPGLCEGQVLFTGSYVDWDGNSTAPTNTLDTLVSQDDDPSNSVSITAPNGRVIMCLPADRTSTVTFTHPDYLPLRYVFEPAAAATAFDIRGLTPVRADELFISLGVTRDPVLAQVIVAVRMATDNPEAVGDAVIGARVALGNLSAGVFTADVSGVYGAGDTITGDASVLFANTEIGEGTTTVTVTPPENLACAGPDTIALVPGEISVTTFACSPL
jgi:hypothetical protein